MVLEFLRGMRLLFGLGAVMFLFGLIIRNAITFLTGIWFLGFSYTVEFNTTNAYEAMKRKSI